MWHRIRGRAVARAVAALLPNRTLVPTASLLSDFGTVAIQGRHCEISHCRLLTGISRVDWELPPSSGRVSCLDRLKRAEEYPSVQGESSYGRVTRFLPRLSSGFPPFSPP